MATTGEMLARLRGAKGLNQLQLGEVSGVRNTSISSMELGKTQPREETLLRLLDALEVVGEERRAVLRSWVADLAPRVAAEVFAEPRRRRARWVRHGAS